MFMTLMYLLIWLLSPKHTHIVAVVSKHGSVAELGACTPDAELLVSTVLTATALYLLTSVKAMNK